MQWIVAALLLLYTPLLAFSALKRASYNSPHSPIYTHWHKHFFSMLSYLSVYYLTFVHNPRSWKTTWELVSCWRYLACSLKQELTNLPISRWAALPPKLQPPHYTALSRTAHVYIITRFPKASSPVSKNESDLNTHFVTQVYFLEALVPMLANRFFFSEKNKFSAADLAKRRLSPRFSNHSIIRFLFLRQLKLQTRFLLRDWTITRQDNLT